jgi:uncharacterized membrane protein
MKIGFFEKWNKDAGVKEFSITRLQMTLATLFAFFFVYQYYITEGNSVTINSIMLIVILFIFAVAPKAIKDFSDIKDKIG